MGDVYDIYYGDSSRSQASIRKQSNEDLLSRLTALEKMIKCQCVAGGMLVMLIILCSTAIMVLIKVPFGSNDVTIEKTEKLVRRSFNEACDIGWIDGHLVHLGCVLFAEDKMNWTDASKFCAQNKGRMVEIHDTNQKTFILNFVKILDNINDRSIPWWAGASDEQVENTWVWTNSRLPVSDFVWAEDRPLKNRRDINYMCINAKYVTLDVSGCFNNVSVLKPICQRDY